MKVGTEITCPLLEVPVLLVPILALMHGARVRPGAIITDRSCMEGLVAVALMKRVAWVCNQSCTSFENV